MRLLIYSGILYLAIVAIVLSFRPALMFQQNGTWKEFGIGRDPELYTWMPFWLFCIVSALMSYFVVVLMADAGLLPGLWVSHVEVSSPAPRGRVAAAATATATAASAAAPGMKPGYYMLNTEGSGIEGVPKYIYLGPAAPGMD